MDEIIAFLLVLICLPLIFGVVVVLVCAMLVGCALFWTIVLLGEAGAWLRRQRS